MISFNIRVRTETMTCIGWSHPAALGPDIPFARRIFREGDKHLYQLFIPGSTFKGALRSSASRIAEAYGFKSCGKIRPELIEKAHEEMGRICDVCMLFGTPRSSVPSPLFISDLKAEGEVETQVLTRVRLEDRSLRVAEGALFKIEYCPAGVEFTGRAVLHGSEDLVELLLLSFAELRTGRIGKGSIIDLKLENIDGLKRIAEERGLRQFLDELTRWLWI